MTAGADTCDGSSFCKLLIINICDGVTARRGGKGVGTAIHPLGEPAHDAHGSGRELRIFVAGMIQAYAGGACQI